MVIRNYDDEDFPQVEELLKKSGIYWSSYDRRDILKKKIENDPESIIVAEDDGNVIGIIFFVYDPWSSYILHLAVDAEHRKKGIGRVLVEEAILGTKLKKADELYLEVRCSNNEAVRLYEKIGFVIKQRLKAYYRDGEDAYLMAIEFSY